MAGRANQFLLGVSILGLVAPGREAQSQTALPQITVTAPSPIVRRAPARPAAPAPPTAPVEPAPSAPAEPALQGTMPVITDTFATVTVVPEQEIERSTGTTLGDVLFSKPGITGTSFAPGAASRPVIRGQDNYRVRIQENGIATGDVSEIGEDHGVTVSPLAAKRIEVIRGPATLRWGSQAIGGVVNVDNNRIPDALPARPFVVETFGAFTTVDGGRDGAIAVDAGAGNVAVHADAYGRQARDYNIPSYPYLFPPDPAPIVDGRQPNSAQRASGQSFGSSYVFDHGFVGVALTHISNFYQVPGIESAETGTRIDMNQTKLTSKGEFRPPSSAIDAIRFWLGTSDYKHNELANENGFDGIQQTFTNKTHEGRVEVQLAPFDLRFAALTTAVGVQGTNQRLTAPGVGGGLFDPNQMTSVAGYVFNELKLSDTLRMQVSGRLEQVNVQGTGFQFPPDFLPVFDPDTGDPLGGPVGMDVRRHFTPKSASGGFLQNLPFGLVGSLTGQYVERAPRAPELFSRGVHEATGTFDIGNPDLTIEVAKSIEVGIRRAEGPVRLEATAYYTKFNGFIFRRLTGALCDDDFASCGSGSELKQAVYSQRDATFRGGEVAVQWDLVPVSTGLFGVDGQYDIVRATFTEGTNVPRIPPQRVGGGIYWRSPQWFARVGLLHAFAQDDIADVETPTPGYNLLKAELSYTTKPKQTAFGPQEVTVGVTGNNLLNEDMRNSVSFKKDEVLLPGRNVKFFANVKF